MDPCELLPSNGSGDRTTVESLAICRGGLAHPTGADGSGGGALRLGALRQRGRALAVIAENGESGRAPVVRQVTVRIHILVPIVFHALAVVATEGNFSRATVARRVNFITLVFSRHAGTCRQTQELGGGITVPLNPLGCDEFSFTL
jgi:hypothetical protein